MRVHGRDGDGDGDGDGDYSQFNELIVETQHSAKYAVTLTVWHEYLAKI